MLKTYDERVKIFADAHWPLHKASGTRFAELIVGGGTHTGTGSGTLEDVNGTLAQQDASGRCIGFVGADSVILVPSHVLLDASAGGLWMLIQPDLIGAKMILAVRRDSEGGVSGTWSFEIQSTGALFGSRRDGTNTTRSVTSATGLITAGDAQHVGIDWGAAGLRLWKDGAIVASEGTPTTDWATTTTSDLRFGRWWDGQAGYDGLMGHVAFRASQPTVEQVGELVLPQGLSLLNGGDLGEVAKDATIVLVPRDFGHFKGTLTPAVTTQGTNCTASVSGENVNVLGANVDASDTFSITVADARGTHGPAAFTVEVTVGADPGDEFITTPEEWGWTSGASVAQQTTAFNKAISDANDNAI